MFSHAELLQHISYDPETGLFSRKVRRTNGKGGWLHKDGYVYIYAFGKTHAAHRLAWFYVTGEWPKLDIDHINGIKHDNRFVNLRDVETIVNSHNETRPRKNNPTGLMGVWFRKDRNKWVAAVRVRGRTFRLGSFSTPEDAHNAYLEGKRKHHIGFTL